MYFIKIKDNKVTAVAIGFSNQFIEDKRLAGYHETVRERIVEARDRFNLVVEREECTEEKIEINADTKIFKAFTIFNRKVADKSDCEYTGVANRYICPENKITNGVLVELNDEVTYAVIFNKTINDFSSDENVLEELKSQAYSRHPTWVGTACNGKVIVANKPKEYLNSGWSNFTIDV